jgi:hypothetical protein
MNFAEAAHEVFQWVGNDPIFCGTMATLGTAALFGSILEYKDHRKNRAAVKANLATRPDIKPIQLPPLNLPRDPR